MTTINIIRETLENGEILTFDEIFNKVRNFFSAYWDIESQNKKISIDELLIKKRGEIYKLLTIHGDFVRLKDNKWTILESNILNS